MKKRTIVIVVSLVLFLGIIGITYAWFGINITGNEDASLVIIKSKELNLVFEDGPEINLNNAMPGASESKIFTITNTGLSPILYSIDWVNIVNDFADKTELVYTLELIDNNTSNLIFKSKDNETIPESDATIDNNLIINANETHTYRLTITFKNINQNQNYNQGKTFSGKININGGEFTGTEMTLKIYVSGVEAASIPKKEEGYFFEKAVCTNNTTLTWNNNSWNYTVNNLIKISECSIYFKKELLAEKILTSYGGASAITQLATTTFASIANTQATSGLFKIADDYGTSYYFRGHRNYVNNNVIFMGFQWKVIRITGEGTIKLIYNGTCPNNSCTINTTGTATQLNASTYAFNTSSSLPLHTGFMYGTSGSYVNATTNTTNSTVKTQLETWYANNLNNKSGKELIVDTIFCNDRQLYSGDGYSSGSTTYYLPQNRVSAIKQPTLKCGSLARDGFTISGSTKGNKKLTYPIGLITADEVAVAGGVSGIDNTVYYLYTNQNYWTMSPNYFISGNAGNFLVDTMGWLTSNYVKYTYGIRPVIALSANTTIQSGNGSSSDPYKIFVK